MDKTTKFISNILLICILIVLATSFINIILVKLGLLKYGKEGFEDKRNMLKKIYKNDDIQDPDEDPDDEGDDPDSDYGVDPDDLYIYRK
jgi:hypothetical protein